MPRLDLQSSSSVFSALVHTSRSSGQGHRSKKFSSRHCISEVGVACMFVGGLPSIKKGHLVVSVVFLLIIIVIIVTNKYHYSADE